MKKPDNSKDSDMMTRVWLTKESHGRAGELWHVEFGSGNRTFRLDYESDDIESAEFMADQLRKSLVNTVQYRRTVKR